MHAFMRNPIFNSSHRWFDIKAQGDEEASIRIYDYIGWGGVGAKEFSDSLDQIKAKRINVMINSPGGDVFDGLAIYNSLKNHGAEIHVTVDGIAASIASVIAMAGDTIVMGEFSFMMIHNPWTVAIGNASDMREIAALLDKVGGSLRSLYAKRSGAPIEQITAWMEAETMFTAQEAVAAKLADRVATAEKASSPDKVGDSVRQVIAETEAQINGVDGDIESSVERMRRRIALVERGDHSR